MLCVIYQKRFENTKHKKHNLPTSTIETAKTFKPRGRPPSVHQALAEVAMKRDLLPEEVPKMRSAPLKMGALR